MDYCTHFNCNCKEITVKKVVDAGNYCDLDCLECKEHTDKKVPKIITPEEIKNIKGNGLNMTCTCEYEWRERFIATIEALREEKRRLEMAIEASIRGFYNIGLIGYLTCDHTLNKQAASGAEEILKNTLRAAYEVEPGTEVNCDCRNCISNTNGKCKHSQLNIDLNGQCINEFEGESQDETMR